MQNSSSEDPAVRITRWGLYSNAGMVVVKGVGGYMLNSQSLIADAGHSVAGEHPSTSLPSPVVVPKVRTER